MGKKEGGGEHCHVREQMITGRQGSQVDWLKHLIRKMGNEFVHINILPVSPLPPMELTAVEQANRSFMHKAPSLSRSLVLQQRVPRILPLSRSQLHVNVVVNGSHFDSTLRAEKWPARQFFSTANCQATKFHRPHKVVLGRFVQT